MKLEMKKHVRRELAEALKPEGFASTSVGYFHRKCEQTVHVINVSYYSNRDAVQYNCSESSFSIEFGIYYDFIPSLYKPVVNSRPRITQCALRRNLQKLITQPGFPNRLVWCANADLSNWPSLVADASSAIKIALPWFDHLSNLENAYEVISKLPHDPNGTWGQGNPGSPIRRFYKAYFAKKLGKSDVANATFQKLWLQNRRDGDTWDLTRFAADFSQVTGT
jgi:hypothetical protein